MVTLHGPRRVDRLWLLPLLLLSLAAATGLSAPVRAPDALSFVGSEPPEWIAEVTSERAVADAGIFDPRAVERLWRKCLASGGGEQFSNADNMALVGVLSTGLLHEQLVRRTPMQSSVRPFDTEVDRLADAGRGQVRRDPVVRPA